jgi:hypothetical protein
MHARLALFAAAALLSANAFAAEPHKAPEHPPAQPQAASPALVLASADGVRTSAPADQSTNPPLKRPIVGRVTTCRCGDPQTSNVDADPDQDQDQDQDQ